MRSRINYLILLGFVLVFSAIVNTTLSACEINFKVIENSKEKYKVGDQIVALVQVHLTHRHCHLSLDDTKFTGNGIQILGGTKWQENSSGVWERKLKLKVTNTNNGKISVKAVRECNKEGGIGFLNLNTEISNQKKK